MQLIANARGAIQEILGRRDRILSHCRTHHQVERRPCGDLGEVGPMHLNRNILQREWCPDRPPRPRRFQFVSKLVEQAIIPLGRDKVGTDRDSSGTAPTKWHGHRRTSREVDWRGVFQTCRHVVSDLLRPQFLRRVFKQGRSNHWRDRRKQYINFFNAASNNGSIAFR